MIATLKSFVGDDAGLASTEYSLLATLIAVAIAGVCGALFTQLSSVYAEVAPIYK